MSTSAVRLSSVSDSDSNPGFRDLHVRNTGATATAYIGGPDVTILNGYPLAPGASLSLARVMPDSPIYAVAAMLVGVAVLEVGV